MTDRILFAILRAHGFRRNHAGNWIVPNAQDQTTRDALAMVIGSVKADFILGVTR